MAVVVAVEAAGEDVVGDAAVAEVSATSNTTGSFLECTVPC